MATATRVRRMVRISNSLKTLHPSSRLHRVALLQGVEPGVEPAGGQELLVGSDLGDAAVFDHQDLIHAAHQPELVGDDEGGAPFSEGTPAVLDGARRLGVEAGLGLVQDQDRALPEHRPRDGDALPLSPGEALPALGEQSLVALRQLADKIVRPGELRGALDLPPRRFCLPVADVLRDRRPEEHRLLRNEGYGVAQGFEREVSDVITVYENPPSLRVVEAGDEARDGGLAGPAQAHERDAAAGLDLEVHPAQNLVGLVFVGEVDVFEGDASFEGGCGAGVGVSLHARLVAQEIYDPLAGDEGLADLVRLPAQGPKRREKEAEIGDEDGELPDGEGPREHLQGSEVQDERGPDAADHAEHDAELRLDERRVHAGPQGLLAL